MNFIKSFTSAIKSFFRKQTVHYINGPDYLPPPLSNEQEAKLIDRYSKGDTSAKDELIVHNLRLVVYISRKFDAASANIEDLISIGTIGLIKAVNTYRSDKKIKLATYASRCIENEILMYLRKTNPIKTEVSFDEPLKAGDKLILCDMAIYSMVKNNTFNGMALPSIYTMKEDGSLMLVRKFGYDDFKMRLS